MNPRPITHNTLFAGIDMPPSAYGTFKQAEKVKKPGPRQLELGGE